MEPNGPLTLEAPPLVHGQEVAEADRAAWLAQRMSGIGASEAAAALGVHPRKSPLELYLEKTGQLERERDGETEAMRWGKYLEEPIARIYERKTGLAVVRREVFLRREGEPLFATLDGVTDAGYPVEFKTIGPFNREYQDACGEEGSDQLPLPWLIQAHQQMLLADAERVDFAVLIMGQDHRLFTVQRNADLIERMVAGLMAFWAKVERRQPPDPSLPWDNRLTALARPCPAGAVGLDASLAETADELALIADQLKDVNATARDLKDRKDALEVRIKAALGDASFGMLPDGRLVSRKVITVAERQAAAYSYDRVSIK